MLIAAQQIHELARSLKIEKARVEFPRNRVTESPPPVRSQPVARNNRFPRLKRANAKKNAA
jgi:hypothetical protein